MTSPKSRTIHFCRIDGRVLFLDLQRDRYFALPAPSNDRFTAAVGDTLMGIITQDDLASLASGSAHLGSSSNMTADVSGHPLAAATNDRATLQDGTPVPAMALLQVILATLAAKALVRLCPLRWLLAGLERGRRPRRTMAAPDSVDRLGAAFWRSSLLIGRDGNCLPLTLAFVWLCRRRGLDPRFVIGVRANPFAAHCWSQDGSMVLNDRYEHVRTFQPILIR